MALIPNPLISAKETICMLRRNEGEWYMHLPEDHTGMALMEGAGRFFDTLSKGKEELHLRMSLQSQDGWGKLELVEHCQAPSGGAVYKFTSLNKKLHEAYIWICDLALLVFGDLPDKIYIKVQSLKNRRDAHPVY